MSPRIEISVPVEVFGIIDQLIQELPALMASGETWQLTLNGTKDKRVFREIKQSAQIDTGPPDKRRFIRKSECR